MTFGIDVTKTDGGGACLRRFLGEEGGATAIEYSVVAAAIAFAVACAIRTLGSNVLTNLYQQIAAAFG